MTEVDGEKLSGVINSLYQSEDMLVQEGHFVPTEHIKARRTLEDMARGEDERSH